MRVLTEFSHPDDIYREILEIITKRVENVDQRKIYKQQLDDYMANEKLWRRNLLFLHEVIDSQHPVKNNECIEFYNPRLKPFG